ncbi:MAG: TetR/AcrR family transcriptional regulator [Proteobacteria bacterium]|nr:TetR/AcrR family transcriptional regulator [Pseudomonadota bacterium]
MSAILKEEKDIISKQSAILEAGFELFAENGFAATRLEDVAARAGVAKGTLYLYFDNKEELFKRVVENTLILNIAPIEAKLEQHHGPVLPLLESVFGHIGEMLSNSRIGTFPKIILAEANNFPELARYYCDNVILRIQGFFTKIIEKGIATGEFRKVDPEASARILMAPFLMLALINQTPVIRDGIGMDPKAHIKAARDILISGLRA